MRRLHESNIVGIVCADSELIIDSDVFRREKDRIALIVLDLSMPGMTGQQALPHLRAIKPEVQVLVTSGYGEVEALRVFEGERLAGFIQKPYTAARLAEKIKGALSEA